MPSSLLSHPFSVLVHRCKNICDLNDVTGGQLDAIARCARIQENRIFGKRDSNV
jgi:hypothetical protein